MLGYSSKCQKYHNRSKYILAEYLANKIMCFNIGKELILQFMEVF